MTPQEQRDNNMKNDILIEDRFLEAFKSYEDACADPGKFDRIKSAQFDFLYVSCDLARKMLKVIE